MNRRVPNGTHGGVRGRNFSFRRNSSYSIAQTDIDHVLRLGGNTDRQRERIVAAFEKQKSTAEIAAYLQNLYTGGNGIGSITAWYAEDGIHLSHGKSARYDKSAQVISWESAAERIGQLLQTGQFATNVELSEAEGYERSLLAEKFWNLYHDFSDEARESGYLPSLANNPGRGFPEESAWLTEQLKSPEFRQTLAEEYAAFWTAYQQDRDLLRFHYHKPKEIWGNLKDLSLPRTAFTSQMTEVPTVKQFITEDEIDSLRRFKDDVKEVAQGYECGIGLDKFSDIKEGDIFEAFIMEEYRD